MNRVAALVGLLAVVCAGGLLVLATQSADTQSPQGPEAPSEAEWSAPTVTPVLTAGLTSATIPTTSPTPLSALTVTPAPTLPSAQSAPPRGSLRSVLDERFADNRVLWPDNPQSTAWIADGGYRLVARHAGQFVAVGAPIAEHLRDVVVTARFRKVAGPAGGGYGLIVRDQGPGPRDGISQTGRFYVLEVSDRGEVGIWRRDMDHWVDLLPWRPSELVRPGEAGNDLMVMAIGQRLTFLVNGKLVDNVMDSVLDSGSVGMFVGGDLNEVVVERFAVQAPEAAVAAPSSAAPAAVPLPAPIGPDSSSAVGTNPESMATGGPLRQDPHAAAVSTAAVRATALAWFTTSPTSGSSDPQPNANSEGVPSSGPTGPLRTVLDEQFTDNQRRWPSNRQETAWILDGAYHLFARVPGQFVAIRAPIAEPLYDVVVTGEFRKIGGPAGGGYGLIVRDQGRELRDEMNQIGRFYVFEAGDRGEVGVWRREGNQWIDHLTWMPSEVVRPGNAANELTVAAVGQRVTFLVNGTVVFNLFDPVLQEGAVGVFVGGDLNEIAIDRFVVQALH
jgi:hypothetical protein